MVDLAKDTLLFENKWVSVYETEDGYTYTYCSPTVVIIPFRLDPQQLKNYEFMFNQEYIPTLGFALRPVSGTLEENESPEQCAIRELREETGYIVNEDDLIFYSYLKGSSSSIHPIGIYFVDVTDKEKGEASTDNSYYEQFMQNLWINETLLDRLIVKEVCSDFIIGACYIKSFLETILRKENAMD